MIIILDNKIFMLSMKVFRLIFDYSMRGVLQAITSHSVFII